MASLSPFSRSGFNAFYVPSFIELSLAQVKASRRLYLERTEAAASLFLFDFKILSSHCTMIATGKITVVRMSDALSWNISSLSWRHFHLRQVMLERCAL